MKIRQLIVRRIRIRSPALCESAFKAVSHVPVHRSEYNVRLVVLSSSKHNIFLLLFWFLNMYCSD